ncbi:MAG: nucleotidyltransferase family protein [Bacteroidales bacterium]
MKNDLNIRDEEILLMGLCRLSFGVELKVMLTALAETVTDWNYFFTRANAHGVAALIYHNVEKLGFLYLMPGEITGKFRNAMMMSLSRNAANIESMGEVLRILNHENIKTILLKGLALELTVYGNCGLRQMTDVDVLVSRDNCMKARKLLMENGFESLPVKSIFHKPIIADIGKHLPTLIKKGFPVEFHHELFGAGKNVLTRILYDTSIETEVNGEKCFVPETQIFFLYLVKHLYLHEMNNESQLRLYTDLVVLIEKYREEILNYDLLTYANQAGMSQILARRLEPLRDLWGISFPDWINEFIDKWYHPDSINKFVFFLKSPKDNPPPGKGQKYRYNLGEVKGIHRKILYMLGEIFPTIDFMKKRYNSKSTFAALLHYPSRWLGF